MPVRSGRTRGGNRMPVNLAELVRHREGLAADRIRSCLEVCVMCTQRQCTRTLVPLLMHLDGAAASMMTSVDQISAKARQGARRAAACRLRAGDEARRHARCTLHR